MIPDSADTIVAIGSAPGGAARGILRISGEKTVACLIRSFSPKDRELELQSITGPRIITGSLPLKSPRSSLSCDLYLWPGRQSYTRQPSAELHTLGSPPLLEAALEAICAAGARLAQPGEFTLRAFLAGRLDLTQAEAVLGVIDAADSHSFQTALVQLAGGLSRPLAELREQLLQVLAQLEAGLDFVEEDIEFISPQQTAAQLDAARELVAATLRQIEVRGQTRTLPRVVLLGPPNSGKSSLYNALLDLNENGSVSERALVSHRAGTTRDYLSATLQAGPLRCELIDTAGHESEAEPGSIASMAQSMTSNQQRDADCCIVCIDGANLHEGGIPTDHFETISLDCPCCQVITKWDLISPNPAEVPADGGIIVCSSVTRVGIGDLCERVGLLLAESQRSDLGVVYATAVRCRESLERADAFLGSARDTVVAGRGDELVAADLRGALHELGSVVGTVYTDDVLDRIFSRFCIGK